MVRPQSTTSPEEKERAAAMDADIIELRRQGIQWGEIGRRMVDKYPRTHDAHGVPADSDEPYSKQYMHHRWKAAIAAVPARKVEEHRAELNGRLEGLLEHAEAVLQREHWAHSNGRVVERDGEPVLDDGPKLAAVAELRKIIAEIRVLNGLTVPVEQKLGVNAALDIRVNGVDLEALK